MLSCRDTKQGGSSPSTRRWMWGFESGGVPVWITCLAAT